MNSNNDQWQRLAAAARQTPQPEASGAPFGFATRVVAQWQSGRPVSSTELWEQLTRRVLALSFAVMIIAGGTGYAMLPAHSSDPVAITQNALEVAEAVSAP
ncbi:MAG TPA: hypothetical protein VK968_18760 [Roseimicrobium sp.]|nr:hypothetical protein [Roseimicrobium sp.]